MSLYFKGPVHQHRAFDLDSCYICPGGGTANDDKTWGKMMDEEHFEIPLERVNPDTLRKMAEEFVTREWSELSDSGHTLDEKVDQVLQQLHDKRARIVYDSTAESWNIIPCR